MIKFRLMKEMLELSRVPARPEPPGSGLDSTSFSKVERVQFALRCIVPKRRCTGPVAHVSFPLQALDIAEAFGLCGRGLQGSGFGIRAASGGKGVTRMPKLVLHRKPLF